MDLTAIVAIFHYFHLCITECWTGLPTLPPCRCGKYKTKVDDTFTVKPNERS